MLPLKDLAFRILLTVAEGEQHGASLARALASTGSSVLPGHLYRTLDRMVADGLIAESAASISSLQAPPSRGTTPTRFLTLTPFGRAVTRAETDRLAALVARSRATSLLRSR